MTTHIYFSLFSLRNNLENTGNMYSNFHKSSVHNAAALAYLALSPVPLLKRSGFLAATLTQRPFPIKLLWAVEVQLGIPMKKLN